VPAEDGLSRLRLEPSVGLPAIQRRRPGVVGLSPWLDYDPGTFDRVWSRGEYKERMQRARHALKTADPQLNCVGCIETDWVTTYPERTKGGTRRAGPQIGPGESCRIRAVGSAAVGGFGHGIGTFGTQA